MTGTVAMIIGEAMVIGVATAGVAAPIVTAPIVVAVVSGIIVVAGAETDAHEGAAAVVGAATEQKWHR
jgi:hypothetical protein